MNMAKHNFVLVVTVLLGFLIMLPVPAFAQATQAPLVCPVSWNNDPKFIEDDPIQPGADGWHDFKKFEYNYTYRMDEFPLEGGERLSGRNRTDVDVTFNTNIATQAFTRVYANMSNIIFPFVNAGDAEVLNYLEAEPNRNEPNSDFNKWLRNYCLGGGIVDSGAGQQAEMTLYTEADMTAEVERDQYYCGLRQGTVPRPPNASTCQDDYDNDSRACRIEGIGCCESGAPSFCTTRREVGTSEETRAVSGRSDTDTFTMPYRLGLRDLALKTAYGITEQYCSTTNADKACLNPNYTCIKEGERVPWNSKIVVQVPDNDPAANGKDGICYLTAEMAARPVPVQVLQRMCSEILENQQVGSVRSLMCHYGDLNYPPSTTALIRVEPQISKATGSTSFDDPTASKNRLPFDVDLFADNGETENPACKADETAANCQINGYFRRALYDRLSLYTPQDKGIFDEMKYRMNITSDNATPYQIDGSNSGSGADMNYGQPTLPDAWSFDYVEKLGGYAMLSEEARIFNPDLLPAGDRVVAEAGHEVYLRGGQVFFDNYVVSNRPRVKPDGTPVDQVSVGYDDFMRMSTAMEYLNNQAQAMLQNGELTADTIIRPLYHCMRFQENGVGRWPDTNAPIDCQGVANRGGIAFKINSGQIGIDPLKDPRVLEVFALFWKSFSEGADSVLGVIATCRAQTTLDMQDCFASKREALNRTFAEFFEAYKALRGEYQSQLSNSNPTLHCVNQRCLVTFYSGGGIFAGISDRSGDIPRIIQLPIEGETFNQISHRGFITTDGRVVVMYSSLAGTYRILIFNPLSGELRNIDTGVNYLGQMDAEYFVDQNNVQYVAVASYMNDQQTVRYQVYDLNSGTPSSSGQINYPNHKLFGVRPGPSISIKYGGRNNLHVVVSGYTPGADRFEGYANDPIYVNVSIGSTVTATEAITTQQVDRAVNRIPNIPQNVFANRQFSTNGKSIYVTPQGVPLVVWINKVYSWKLDEEPLPTNWEFYTQAFIAKRVPGSGWSVLPISDRAVGVLTSEQGMMSEIRSVFISPSAVGMTVNDAVTKRNTRTRMLDGSGTKRCVYNHPSVIFFGSLSCGNLENVEYVKSNGGNMQFVPAVRP